MITARGKIAHLALAVLTACLLLPAAACGTGQETDGTAASSMPGSVSAPLSAPVLADCPIIHEPDFGGVNIECAIDDFDALGFEYGDSVDVSFTNGYVLEGIPYYNGYYVDNGDPLLIAYKGHDYIKAAFNNGDDLWVVAGLDEDCLATVTLAERAAYRDIQEARDISYEDDRSGFPSDDAFANFRSVQVGNMAAGVLYRSASPCNNKHQRAPYVDGLMGESGVDFVVDLADTDEKIQGYVAQPDFASPNFLALYEAGKVAPLALNSNYGSPEYAAKVAQGMLAILENDGPYLVHCTEGKDRTGFFCMLVEALCGASYQEIVDDYMVTYDNYYQITEESDKARYDAIVESVLLPMIQTMVDDEAVDVTTANLSVYAEGYLEAAGVTAEQVAELKAVLC